ncbi:MAG TPA: proline--tRNA ligase [Chlamydiales bacterium]|nr:proline--tRNA ligase [Chlamydiales bacterium]
MAKTAIQPSRKENFPNWYQEVIKAADLAEHSPVRGCMVIKPWGYGIWERMQKILDTEFKKHGVENAYFPLFIPVSYMEKEAKHVAGFAKECAVVTHHRLEQKGDSLVPAAPLEEPLIVRPTSEMIIGEMFAKWTESYRDLPILINQWANVVRWEMRTRMFLRTVEFLWQEGHTAHETKKEAEEMTKKMLETYAIFAKDSLAISVIKGVKTRNERFPGAEETYCIEAMMQDGKALQAGTSHFLGQNFSKSSNISFRDANGEDQFAWTTSWGVATRLIGAVIMSHGDDDGLRLPPAIAPYQIVILPVIHNEEVKDKVVEYCENLKKDLEKQKFRDEAVRVHIDYRDIRGGEKKWNWVKKGVPVRIEIGPRDIEKNQLYVSRRDLSSKENFSPDKDQFVESIETFLEEIQIALYEDCLQFRKDHTTEIQTKEEFYQYFKKDDVGFAVAYYDDNEEIEEMLKKDLNVTVRCIPVDQNFSEGKCVFSQRPTTTKAVFAKAY